MRKITDIREMQQIGLLMLADVDNYCRKNNIKYFIGYGTLLGAVRHKGFIPWDDDIDIIIPREDYDRFIKGYGNERYKVLSNEYSEDYYYNFAKVVDLKTYAIERGRDARIKDLGLYIDVFPVDGLKKNKGLSFSIHYKKAHLLNRMLLYSKNPSLDNRKSLGNRILWKYSRRIGFSKLMKKFRSCIKTNKNNYSMVIPGIYGKKDVFPTELISEIKRMPYETIEVNVPGGYDELLTQLYGDYMTPPPESDRVKRHNTEFGWR